MIACISPSYLAYEETKNTLKYGQRARKISHNVKANIMEIDLNTTLLEFHNK